MSYDYGLQIPTFRMLTMAPVSLEMDRYPITLCSHLARTQIEITGADRASFLHNFCTNHIKGLAVGQGCEAIVTNIKGRILFYVLVFAGPESLWMEAEPGQAGALLAHLERYLITEDVQLIDRSGEFTQLYLSGSSAETCLAQALGRDLATLPSPGQIVAQGVLVRRFSFGSAPGFSLVGAPSEIDAWSTKLLADGAIEGSAEWFEALRIEAGFPKHGVDLTEDHLAQEANRTKLAISFTKGCYLGQEPIARIDALGHVNRLLCGVISDDPTEIPAGTEVFSKPEATTPSGTLTSTAIWPATGLAIGLGMLRREISLGGTACFLGPSRLPAHVRVWPS